MKCPAGRWRDRLTRGTVVVALVGIWLLAAGCGGPDLGTEFRMNPTVRVESGERFSLSVPSNASASDGPADAAGSGGTRYFVFTARERGETTIVLFNCFQQRCTGRQSPADDDPLSPRKLTLVVVVVVF